MIFLYMDVWFYIWQDCLQWYCTTSAAIQVQVKTDYDDFGFKGSSDPSHFIFDFNVGKSRIRHTLTLNFNDAILNLFWADLEIQFQSRSMSDPTLSDIDFKNKMTVVWTTLKIIAGTRILLTSLAPFSNCEFSMST